MAQATAMADETFEEAIRRNRAVLHRTATRMTGAATDADDLVQETLVRAFGSYSRLEPGSHVRAWLLRILSNTFISGYRRRRRERALLVPGVWEQHAPWLAPAEVEGGEPAPRLEGLGDEVLRALESLPSSYRTAIVMVDIEEKTYREAAEALGRPIGTVMSRLHRGRRMLRALLAEYARDEGYCAAA